MGEWNDDVIVELGEHMSLQFIVGSAGSGKSTTLYQRVVEEALLAPSKHFFVIVPEQFTMQTQRQLVDLHPRHAILNIDVLSFNRLAHRIFDELGTDVTEVLEETGKSLLLRKVAQEQEANLTVLGAKMKRPGYIAQVKSLISEFSQYNIAPEDLEALLDVEGISEGFRQKGQDLLVIYRAFEDKIAGQYVTSEKILEKLCEVAEDSSLLRGATIVFDGFTGFTPIQNDVLRKLLVLSDRLVVTMTMDAKESIHGRIREQELFAMSKKTIQSLEHMAVEAHVPVEEAIFLRTSAGKRFVEGGQLAHLEANLFRLHAATYKKKDSAENGEETSDALRIVSFASPRQELSYAAAEIARRVRTEGLRYRDFAIVCANLEGYQHYAAEIFRGYDVPYFIDAKREATFNPLLESVHALFSILEDDFSQDSVLRLLRAGMLDCDVDAIDRFENYLLATNLRGRKRYAKPLVLSEKKYTEQERESLEAVRASVYAAVSVFVEMLIAEGDSSVRLRDDVWIRSNAPFSTRLLATALYQFVAQYQMQQKLSARAALCEERGDVSLADTYRQIYALFLKLLDKMVTFLGDEQLSVEEFHEILTSGMESLSVGLLPPSKDCVMIGDIERTRLSDVKILFFIGASDDAIPESIAHGGILTQMDRQKLLALGANLAPSDRERAFMQRFYLYFVMTKPSQELIVSYARVGSDGSALRPSYLVRTLQKLFPELSVDTRENLPVEDYYLSEASLRERYVHCLLAYAGGPATAEVSEELALLYAKEGENTSLADAAFYRHQAEHLSPAVREAIYGGDITTSISRLESYAQCAYSYYLQYLLFLREREEYALEALDLGNLYHDVLDRYARRLGENKEAWDQISDNESTEILEASLEESLTYFDKTDSFEEPRGAYTLQRVRTTLEQTIRVLRDQVRKGEFVPSGFEVDFHEVRDTEALSIAIDEMHKIRLRGKIDRIDLAEVKGKVYVKIVDYKSSGKDIDFNKLYNGTQVQLILYMDAAMEAVRAAHPDQEVLPGAMFYYHIDRPLLEEDDLQKAKKANPDADPAELLDVAIRRALRVKGLINEDPDVVQALDRGIEVGTESEVIPVGRKKDGAYTNGSDIISHDDFQTLSDYVHLQMERTGRLLSDGVITCAPLRGNDDNDACKYCSYHSVCGFDPSIDGFYYRKMGKLAENRASLQKKFANLQEKVEELQEEAKEREGR